MRTLFLCVVLTVSTALLAQEEFFQTGVERLHRTRYTELSRLSPFAAPAPRPEPVLLTPLPPARHQGVIQPSCVGWVVAYAMKTYQEALEWKKADVELAQHQFSPSYIYNLATKGDCNHSIPLISGLEVAKSGAASLDRFDYEDYHCPVPQTIGPEDAAYAARIRSYGRVGRDDQVADDALITDIRGHIAEKRPVLLMMSVDSKFRNLRDEIYAGPLGKVINEHAVAIVGDDFERRRVLIQNSFGRSWGKDGRAWMTYDALKSVFLETYVAFDHIENPPTPTLHLTTQLFTERFVGVLKSSEVRASAPPCPLVCPAPDVINPLSLPSVTAPAADEILKNLRLECIGDAGPCRRKEVYDLRTLGGDTAIGTIGPWDPAARWKLVAERFKRVPSERIERLIPVGQPFSIVVRSGDPVPTLTGQVDDQVFTMPAGESTPPVMTLDRVEMFGDFTIYHYRTASPLDP